MKKLFIFISLSLFILVFNNTLVEAKNNKKDEGILIYEVVSYNEMVYENGELKEQRKLEKDDYEKKVKLEKEKVSKGNFSNEMDSLEITPRIICEDAETCNITKTITFNSNGGTYVSSITKAPGTTVIKPQNPTRQGFIFDGWYQNSSLTIPYTFTIMSSNNLILYAKWNCNLSQLDCDKYEFGENSDTYKILVDLNNRWLATSDNEELNRIQSLSEDVRIMYREGTPLLYNNDKIMNLLIENSNYMELNRVIFYINFLADPAGTTVNMQTFFYDLVKTGGEYDYKNQSEWQYPYETYHGNPANKPQTDFMYFEGMLWSAEKLGNFHFGYIGAAFGYPEEFMCLGAGMYQIYSGTSKWIWISTYWDEPVDSLFIRMGSRMYNTGRFENLI